MGIFFDEVELVHHTGYNELIINKYLNQYPFTDKKYTGVKLTLGQNKFYPLYDSVRPVLDRIPLLREIFSIAQVRKM
jgi:hypothetical protein